MDISHTVLYSGLQQNWRDAPLPPGSELNILWGNFAATQSTRKGFPTLLDRTENLRVDRNPFITGIFKCNTNEKVPKIFSRCARLSNTND